MSSNPERPAHHGWLIANLLAQLAFGLLAMTIGLPSMQEWPAMFGASQAAVQLTFSGYVLTYGLLQLVYGPMSDRLGRRRVLMFGLFITLLGSVVAALATDLSTLVIGRVLQGAGSAAGMVVGRALIQDLFQGPERTRVMAYVGMAMGLCPPLGTIVGGQLHVTLGWQANFVLMAVLAVVLWVSAWRGLPAHQPSTGPQAHWLRAMLDAYGQLLKDPRFVLYVCLLSMTSATFYAFLGAAPLVLGSYGVGPDGIGFYIMFVPGSYIVGNFLTSHLVHRLGDQRMMWMGQALTATGIGLMLVLALAGFNSPLALALPLMLMGLGNGFMVPPALAGTVGLMPALAGSAAAVAGLMQQLAAAVGGFAVGLVSHNNAVNLALVMMVLCLLGVAAQAALRQVLRPAGPRRVRN
ncbi:multidrug effflux MFS transporter [Hydrogenophaga sp.]|uniref:multidrug effflux MFS transporter n=3 Tax=Hydrogenophaga sp. TaxID=1904254 RepID=UPI002CB62558|nr:multidrug effflux MFS transporter [Hydrogenophaga sp.]HMP12022.1 multidrug effflux MFS transporter [Hydrogenophaga sp.]